MTVSLDVKIETSPPPMLKDDGGLMRPTALRLDTGTQWAAVSMAAALRGRALARSDHG